MSGPAVIRRAQAVLNDMADDGKLRRAAPSSPKISGIDIHL
jgi:hypothetical protein